MHDEFHGWRHADAILAHDFPNEWRDIPDVLPRFRLLFDLRALSAGVIITRSGELQDIFNNPGRKSSFGALTTHMSRLLSRIEGGGGVGCPLWVFGIIKALYVDGGGDEQRI
ncbi:hypothetical protein D3P04_11235 [Paracoccus onubensis]|uniref:Uncharacterized protein n=2 Tax=Paracoccus onubensis TaxID=1675788 RepID=A0A418SVW0_9RHOB|nr:hypothetical protein D3P04_11235 [Paracoccus onubensis]